MAAEAVQQWVKARYNANQDFVAILKEQVLGRGWHAMRYFGLLAPRSKAQTGAAVFALLGQKQRTHPRRLGWRSLRRKTFGIDPLLDNLGQIMRWVARLSPISG